MPAKDLEDKEGQDVALCARSEGIERDSEENFRRKDEVEGFSEAKRVSIGRLLCSRNVYKTESAEDVDDKAQIFGEYGNSP